MQPIRCEAGYAVPIKVGKMEIMAVQAPGNDITAISRLVLVDNGSGTVLSEDHAGDRRVIEMKRAGEMESNMTFMCPEPIKVLNGVNVTYAQNVAPGSILVYIR